MKISKEDVDYMVRIYEAALKLNKDPNTDEKLKAYANGTLYGFECVINTLNQNIPGLTDMFKLQMGFSKD